MPRQLPLFAAFLLFALCLPAIVHAEEDADSPARRDIVLILDNSGSLRSTDPQGLSKQAAGLLARLIGGDDALGVVAFDEKARVLSPLAPLPDSKARDRLARSIAGLRRDGKLTHIEAALEAAYEEFSGATSRPRTAILLTDSQIDLDDDVKTATPDEQRSRERIQGELAERYRKAGIMLYTIAFRGGADAALLEALAKATGGLAFAVAKPSELSEVYFSIFNQVAAPQQAPIKDGRFQIDASVNEATVIVQAHEVADRLELQDPNGARHRRDRSSARIRWGGNAAYLMATIADPLPGAWHILGLDKEEANVILLTDVELEAPVLRNRFYRDEPIPVLARLDHNLPLEELPDGIGLTAILLTEDGSPVDSVALADDGPEKGGCRSISVDRMKGDWSSGAFAPKPAYKPGRYRIQVQAQADTFSRMRQIEVEIVDAPWIGAPSTEMRFFMDEPVIFRLQLARDFSAMQTPASVGAPAYVDGAAPATFTVLPPSGARQTFSPNLPPDGKYELLFDGEPEEGAYELIAQYAVDGRAPLCPAAGKTIVFNLRRSLDPGVGSTLPFTRLELTLMAAVLFQFIVIAYLLRRVKAPVPDPIPSGSSGGGRQGRRLNPPKPAWGAIPAVAVPGGVMVAGARTKPPDAGDVVDADEQSAASSLTNKLDEILSGISSKTKTMTLDMGQVDSLLGKLDGLMDDSLKAALDSALAEESLLAVRPQLSSSQGARAAAAGAGGDPEETTLGEEAEK
ncbi:MAG: VWA domain-containing protein, partial [Myxococcales bacterium]